MHAPLASGGMATVYLGRLLGAVGFSRTVAIKRLHPQYAKDPEFIAMFLDEARVTARIRHANVIPTLDVVAEDDELFLVMDYAPGESLGRLAKTLAEQDARLPLRVVSAIMGGILRGLHAAHETRDEQGAPLHIVHRDVSPQNVLVGTDGVAKLLDFGVAKAAGRSQVTREGQLKGKLGYMPPEQLCGAEITRAGDLYAVGVVLWELVAGARLFRGENEGVIVVQVLRGGVPSPFAALAQRGATASPEDTAAQRIALEQVILRALAPEPAQRHATAHEMALALDQAVPPAPAAEVAAWVERLAPDALLRRAQAVEALERSPSVSGAYLAVPAPPPASSGRVEALSTGSELRGPSSLAVVTRGVPASSARDKRVALGGAAVGLFLGLGALALVVLWQGARVPSLGRVAAAGSASAFAPPEPSGPSVPTSASARVPESVPSAAASALPPTSPPSTPSVRPPAPSTVAAKPARRSPAPKLDCSPPYTTDADGIRHFKPGCV